MKNLIYKTSFILIALIIAASVSYAESVWTNNDSIPTTNNAETPLNVGSDDQIKPGPGTLTLSELSANVVNVSTEFCIYPNNCINSWPSSSGSLTGSGTVNYLAKWDTTASLTDSQIYENGTDIGIKETNPNYEIDVNGDINANTICINGNCKSTWPSDSAGNYCYTQEGKTISNGGVCVRETETGEYNRIQGYSRQYVHLNICQNGTLVDLPGTIDLGTSYVKGNTSGNRAQDIVYCSNI